MFRNAGAARSAPSFNLIWEVVMSLKQYLKDRIIIDENGCWIWQNYIDKSKQKKGHGGYGIAWYYKKLWKAHRLSYTAFKGSIPKGLYVCHHCDVRNCINPDHLFLATQKDNVRDMLNKKRGNWPGRQGEKHHSVKLTEKDVKKIIELRKAGKTNKDIAPLFNINRNTVYRIFYKKRWKHI